MNLIVVGLSHKTAPVEMREKLAFRPNQIEGALKQLNSLSAVAECLILSTCNRVEIYAKSRDGVSADKAIRNFIADYHQLTVEQIDSALYTHFDQQAVGHLFKVAASLDSMVVGEPQILGQLKDAYQTAKDCSTTGLLLNSLLSKAFGVAKRVRTETGIGQSAVSISFAAVELAKKIFGNLQDKAVLIIGAGEMSELVAQHLITNGVQNIFVANRTYERAVEMADKFKGEAIKYDRILDQMYRADIIISSTGAPHTIIHHDDVAGAIQKRKHRPMFLIDIAVPRDIEASINQIDSVYLYDIDDLQSVVEANIKERRREAKLAEEMISREVTQFCVWLKRLDVAPTIVALKNACEAIRLKELNKALKKLKDVSESERKIIEAMTQGIINKILHKPITCLKCNSASNDLQIYIDTTRQLFGLKDKD